MKDRIDLLYRIADGEMGIDSILEDKILCLGFMRGLSHDRPGNEKQESKVMSRLRHLDGIQSQLMSVGDSVDSNSEKLYRHGYSIGLGIKIEADYLAFRLRRYLFGGLRSVYVFRLLSNLNHTYDILFSLNSEMLDLVKSAYLCRYAEDLDSSISKLYKGSKKHVLKLLIHGKKVEAVSVILRHFASRRSNKIRNGVIIDYLKKWLEGFDEKQRADLASSLAGITVHRKGLFDYYLTWFPPKQHLELKALFNGELLFSDLIELRNKLSRRYFRTEGVTTIFNRLTKYPRDSILNEYRTKFGEDIKQFLHYKLGHGAYLDLGLAILEGDHNRKRAAQLNLALSGVDPEQFGELFLNRTEAERCELIQSFETSYPGMTLRERLQNRFSGIQLEILSSVIFRGEVNLGRLLYLCVVGLGTDEEGLRLLLDGRSELEIASAREDFFEVWRTYAPFYEKWFPSLFGCLDRRIWIETGGDTWFDLRAVLKMSSLGNQGNMKHIEALYCYENGGLGYRVLNFFSTEVEVLKSDLERIRQFYSQADQESGELHEDRKRALQLYFEQDCDCVRKLKHIIGNTISDQVAKAAALVSAISLSLVFIPITEIMALVAMMSIVTRLSLKVFIKGSSYSWDELGGDFLFGLFDGATLFCSRFVRQALYGGGARLVMKVGLRTGWHQMSRVINRVRIASYCLVQSPVDYDLISLWQRAKHYYPDIVK